MIAALWPGAIFSPASERTRRRKQEVTRSPRRPESSRNRMVLLFDSRDSAEEIGWKCGDQHAGSVSRITSCFLPGLALEKNKPGIKKSVISGSLRVRKARRTRLKTRRCSFIPFVTAHYC